MEGWAARHLVRRARARAARCFACAARRPGARPPGHRTCRRCHPHSSQRPGLQWRCNAAEARLRAAGRPRPPRPLTSLNAASPKRHTRESAINISPDLVREFDDRWWNAARKGEAGAMAEMLKYSRELLSQVVDDNGRR